VDPLKLEVIVGSVRAGRFAPVVVDWFTRRVGGEFEVGVLDLVDFDLPVDLSATPAVEAFCARVAAADAFVVVTSEYNHGYSAALKTALDSAKREWRGKPVGFVAYGGLSGGLRAVEQLRQVVAELHMVSVREAVSFHQMRERFTPDGETHDEAAIDACGRMLAQLAWWGRALRTARPYPR
jgi:NAD(P)H-dependent FMN reductase